MKPTPTANQLRGRATGSLFFAGFGALWIILALYVKQMVTPMNLALVSGDLAVLLVAAFWLFRQSKFFAKVPEDPVQSRKFNRINLIQWIAVIAVAFTFGRLHWDAYVLCAITGIVGLHMFPLAKLFHYPMHYVTGTALLVWAIASAMLVPADRLQGTSALGTGILLWISSWITLAMAIQAARSRGFAASEYGTKSS